MTRNPFKNSTIVPSLTARLSYRTDLWISGPTVASARVRSPAGISSIVSDMASDSPELRMASPSAQPLLRNHITSDFDISPAKSPVPGKEYSVVKERALEDGDNSDLDSEASLESHPTFWGRCLMAVRRRRPSFPRVDYESGRLPAFERKRRAKKYVWRKRHGAWGCLGMVGFVVFFFGCVHIVNVSLGYLPLIHDDPATFALDWTQPNQASADMASYLLDITRDVTPIPCHSHNDYWRRVPLYDALRWGCTGVEADVWLSTSQDARPQEREHNVPLRHRQQLNRQIRRLRHRTQGNPGSACGLQEQRLADLPLRIQPDLRFT
ncbi:hypothetical protein OPT61_g10427 [Boeremia exigua]|uniref:Uncharacterized protein n=1 Tax=Boeremia exigua TaxID=749465 RepID=A0ACC2HPQ4_9PLEO|nr:hypothetical protein OPT61_g10427 [Boeremia exigua]